ncbi:MAG TPA: hypothetical protein VFM70_06490 [Salinimicrobium sp.]|nr:hypothetical protein [Salinimicrobium sp.]
MNNQRSRYRIFYNLEQHLEVPMFILAIVWMYFLVVEFFHGLNKTQETIIYVIWFLFIAEYLIKLLLAPRKITYIKNNWITLIALIIPALRVFRIFYAVRLLRSVRVIRSTNIIRTFTTGKRFFSALKEAQGPQPEPEMNVGILIAHGNLGDLEKLKTYVNQLIDDITPELKISTGIRWNFDLTETRVLENENPVRPSFFLDSASLKMAEGPYDLVAVVTDVALMSRKNQIEAGLSSPVARMIVLSTKKLITTGRNQPSCSLNDTKVRYNSALLMLHLIGHILKLKHRTLAESKIMRTYEFNPTLAKIPSFNSKERKYLKKNAQKAPDRELINGNFVETFIFHVLMTFRHLPEFFRPLFHNWAIFLPLSLPSLVTAAVAPSILLIFGAEIWDVGLGMSNGTATFFAIVSVMLASFYLVRIQSLFLPRKEKRVLTEHLAVANSVIYFSIFLACIGLFLTVGVLTLIIEFYVFPEDLMQTWPTLNKPEILLSDKIRLAAFISTIGVTTGALAGGLESRTVIQQLALFKGRT